MGRLGEETSVVLDRRPVVGIVTQTVEASGPGMPRMWSMNQAHIKALTRAGAVPWLVPLLGDDPVILRELYDQLDGLYLAGGRDVHPEHYGQGRLEVCRGHDPERDQVELRLVRWAVDDGKPILGICRGLQVINVALGGSLYQDLATEFSRDLDHDCFPAEHNTHQRHSLIHDVRFATNSRLGEVVQVERVGVNSMHHQGVRTLAPGLVPTAHADDGLIEGVESRSGGWLLAVQWHPEELIDAHETARRLYQRFVDEMAHRRRSSTGEWSRAG